MSRPLRIEIPGGLYHVMSRGNDRRPIVRDDADRQKRLEWLRRTVETYGGYSMPSLELKIGSFDPIRSPYMGDSPQLLSDVCVADTC